MKRKQYFHIAGIAAACVAALFILASCAAGESPQSGGEGGGAGIQEGRPSAESGTSAPEEVSRNPVKLSMYYHGGDLTDEEFQIYFLSPLAEKYPHITLELVRNQKGSNINDLIAAGSPPDLIYTPQNYLSELLDLAIAQDLRDWMRAQNVDIARFETVTINSIQSYGASGELIALPFSYNNSALFYNRDIFDKFGVEHPRDYMLWDEVIELGEKVARAEGDVQYKALYPSALWQFGQQLLVPYTDPSTHEPMLEHDAWKKAASYFKRIYEIPGNEGTTLADFFTAKDTAMYAGVTNYMFGQATQMLQQGVVFNWDLVSYPNFPETKGQSMALASQVLVMATTSKHQDHVFQVIDLVTGAENQLQLSRNGRLSSLRDPKLKEAYGSNNLALEGKNIQAIFHNTPPVQEVGLYFTELRTLLNQAQANLIGGDEDINTFLRNLNEQAGKIIAEKRATGG